MRLIKVASKFPYDFMTFLLSFYFLLDLTLPNI